MTGPKTPAAASPSSPLRLRVLPASAWPEVESTWRALFSAGGSRSFFLSPDWVSAWLQTFASSVKAEIVFFDGEEGPVGATLLTTRQFWLAFVPLRQIHLHTAGEPDADSAVVEYIAPLHLRHRADDVHAALGTFVESRSWDEFILSGVPEGALEPLVRAVPGAEVETHWELSYAVDLARLRRAGSEYTSVLSKNSLDQLKRSLKLYRERGELTVDFASTLEEARAQLAELEVLHQQRWEARGEPGAFASERFRAFHHRLITRAFPRGGVQLVRVRAGETTIGVLYNFVESGAVMFYQSGFRYEKDNRFKPGVVTHALVIQECLNQGLDSYDFLRGSADGSRYKQSLANESHRLAWTVLRRSTVRTRVVATLRRIKRLIRKPKTASVA